VDHRSSCRFLGFWAAPAFLLMPARLAPRICFAVLAVALTVGIVIYSRGLNLRAAYTGSLTNFGLMALGGAAVLVFTRNFLMAKSAAPALIFYLACPVLAFLLGRSSIGGELIFWLSGVLITDRNRPDGDCCRTVNLVGPSVGVSPRSLHWRDQLWRLHPPQRDNSPVRA
jgi:hypothetical protein